MTNFQISKLLLGCLVVLPALAWAGTPAASSTMVPTSGGSCPTGSNNAGADYCQASELGVSFVPTSGGSCPTGSTNAGADYCRVDK